MIYKLEVENFYSIRERQVIDLTVGRRVPDEPGRLVPIYYGAKDRAPNVVAIYGANASGKSNVLRAITFLTWFVEHSFGFPAGQQLPYHKFQTSEMIGKESKFSLSFTGLEDHDDPDTSRTCPYFYDLTLSPREVGRGDYVVSENLYYKPYDTIRPIRIFERKGRREIKTGQKLGASNKEISVLESIIRPDASLISTLAQLNNSLAIALVAAARSVETNILVTRFDQNEFSILQGYANDQELLSALNRDIKRIDLGVDQVQILARNGAPIASFSHAGLDFPLEMWGESQGTQHFFRIYPVLYRILQTGGVAVIDELDSAIHPNVLPEIARWFSDPERNPHGAQLWMSCHAVSLLDDLLKEEVLICEKSSDGASQIYSLGDISGIRRGENFAEKYLGGSYGGIPSIG